ncbi:MAG: hypothetical protein P3X22_002800 [Thermoprotei archaeon]|nr:hypothetical protein [Thermoprotei archaeon]
MEKLLAYTVKILGLRLLAVIIVSITLYSTASAYIGGSLIGLLELPLNPEPSGDLGLLSVYSGTSIAPITGIVEAKLLEELSKAPGVLAVWPESTAPCLANGSPVIVRGVPEVWAQIYKPRILSGTPFNASSYSKAWVGAELARKLKVKPGDIIVLKPLFTRADSVLKIAGILEAGQPYNYEVIVPLHVGYSLRGSSNPSVVRVIYDPEVTSLTSILGALGHVERAELELPGELVRAASALIYKGYVRAEAPEALQEYYLRRLGIPREIIFLAALASILVVALLNVTPALLIYTARGRSFRVIVDQGVEPSRVKASILLVALPLIIAGSSGGVVLASLLNPLTIAGYPARPSLELNLIIAHISIQVTLYTIGLVLGDLR